MRIKKMSAAMLGVILSLTGVLSASAAQVSVPKAVTPPIPKFSKTLAFAVSPAVRNLATVKVSTPLSQIVHEVRPERGPVIKSIGFAGDAAVQHSRPSALANIPSPLLTFEGVGLSVPAIYFFAVFRNRVAAISVRFACVTIAPFLR